MLENENNPAPSVRHHQLPVPAQQVPNRLHPKIQGRCTRMSYHINYQFHAISIPLTRQPYSAIIIVTLAVTLCVCPPH